MSRRLLLCVLAVLIAVTTAVGPSRLAAAAGLVRTASGEPGFLPAPTPVRVTAPAVRISRLTSILDNQRIPVAGGGQSPGVVLLEFSGIELDQLTLSHDAAPAGLRIVNEGSGAAAATIGGAGQTVRLWGVLKRLDVCLSSLPGADPCPDIAGAKGLLSLLVRGGVKLPDMLRGKNLDIEVYALTVTGPDGATSLSLPQGRLSQGAP